MKSTHIYNIYIRHGGVHSIKYQVLSIVISIPVLK